MKVMIFAIERLTILKGLQYFLKFKLRIGDIRAINSSKCTC